MKFVHAPSTQGADDAYKTQLDEALLLQVAACAGLGITPTVSVWGTAGASQCIKAAQGLCMTATQSQHPCTCCAADTNVHWPINSLLMARGHLICQLIFQPSVVPTQFIFLCLYRWMDKSATAMSITLINASSAEAKPGSPCTLCCCRPTSI